MIPFSLSARVLTHRASEYLCKVELSEKKNSIGSWMMGRTTFSLSKLIRTGGGVAAILLS